MTEKRDAEPFVENPEWVLSEEELSRIRERLKGGNYSWDVDDDIEGLLATIAQRDEEIAANIAVMGEMQDKLREAIERIAELEKERDDLEQEIEDLHMDR